MVEIRVVKRPYSQRVASQSEDDSMQRHRCRLRMGGLQGHPWNGQFGIDSEEIDRLTRSLDGDAKTAIEFERGDCVN